MSKQKISYSDAINEIEEILKQIENGELGVDELTEKVKRVTLLIKICKTKLKSTEEEIKSILGEENQDEDKEGSGFDASN